MFATNKLEGVQIHFAGLEEAPRWLPLLTSEEKMQTEKIVNPKVLAGFIVSRGLRRQVLSTLLCEKPERVQFTSGEGGKPHLVMPGAPDFNLSHSGEFVVMAVADSGHVGIDLEVLREVRDMGGIATRFFHPDEAAAWENLGPAARLDGFFVLWSAREAAMKCAGLGLARGLSITRIDAGILQEKEAGGRVGSMEVRVDRMSAPDGHVMVLAQA
jgi:4'-phosphopantetheinyl transferase